MFPIILAHGIARFDILRERINQELNLPPNRLDDELQYFRNIRTHLNANGFAEVFNTNVDFAGSVRLRAEQLKRQINDVLAQSGAAKAHVIAHSMGGLDARLMIVDLEMAERVASLTTIGTPHLGTSLANRVIGAGGWLLMRFLKDAVRLNLEGFQDLTTDACEAFNRRALDAEAKNEVAYRTFSSFEEGSDMFVPLIGSWFYIRGVEGRNDGLVSVRSQSWTGELIAADGTRKQITQKEFPIAADHLNQCGWWDWAEVVDPQRGGSLLNQKANYEAQIKNVYLEIAAGLES